ncbi:MAG: PAS domain S-box protein [Candidatus Thermoplasmatota archaeon]|nr:PAS domain S-box protein [Candidatus Thermoplasmatota archaeon]MBU1941037.1 PAS domain S-box protein [Candidatus Thermoplasmatota archaeon]
MEPIALITLFAAILSFFIGFYVYRKDPKRDSIRVFFSFTIFIAIYNFGEFLTALSPNPEFALLSGRIVYTALWLTPAAAIHFTLVFPRSLQTPHYQSIVKILVTISYGIGFIIYLIFNATVSVTDVELTEYGYAVIPTNLTIIFVFWFVMLYVISFGILIYKYFFGDLYRIEQEQISIFIFASLLIAVISLGTNLLPPLFTFQYFPLPIISIFLVAVFVIILAFPINQYRFLSISPELFAENIFNTMSDLVITLDKDKKIDDVNKAVANLLGYAKKDLIGTTIAHIIEKPDSETLFNAEGKKNIDVTFLSQEQKQKTLSLIISVIKDKNQTIKGYVVVGRDLTDLKRSLKEKEILLQEVHHRVKNNLQLISSLLDLQSDQIKDLNTHEIFKDSQDRIRLMAAFYEQIYQAKDIGAINIRDYLENITSKLFHSYRKPNQNISLNMDIDDLTVDLDTILTCSFIISELVSNSLKHAFHHQKTGAISIEFHKQQKDYLLRVSDTGDGFPDTFDFHKTETLGLQLVQIFVKQLKGTVMLDHTTGTSFTIQFPYREKKHDKGGKT